MNSQQTPGSRQLPSGTDLPIPWHLSLPDTVEREFVTYLLQLSRRVILACFSIIAVICVAGYLFEWLLLPETLAEAWRARLISLSSIGLVWWAAYDENHPQRLQPAVAVFAITAALTSNYMAVRVGGQAAYAYLLANLFVIMLLSTLFRITLRWTLPIATVLVIATAITIYGLSDLATEQALLLFFYIFGGAVLCLSGQYFIERLQRQYFLAEKVLALHRSELHSANQVLSNQATEDAMTNTLNRRGMEQRLEQLLAERRNGESGKIFAVLFDIDFFKQYNDTYGHLAGDDCLIQVASVPRSLIQNDRDFVARYGGEEFLVILTGIQEDDALVFAERMRNRVEKLGIPHSKSRAGDVVTISVGVAGLTNDITRPEQLILRADEALYEAKGRGRNRVIGMNANNELFGMD